MHNILISIDNHGFTLKNLYLEFLEKRELVLKPENFQTIAGLLTLPFFTCTSYWIEILATYPAMPRVLLHLLISINLVSLLVFPIAFSFYFESNAAIATYLLLYTATTFFKLLSFHHVFHDVRCLVRRVIRMQRAQADPKKYPHVKILSLEPSLTEGTILGVNKSDFDEALTYPHCLRAEQFLRFMISPTCCYQLKFPLHDKVCFKRLGWFFLEFLIANSMIIYIFLQHFVPNCQTALIFFE